MTEGVHSSQFEALSRKRTRDPAEVRRRLLTAATKGFAEHGFEGVNSNQIARDAGVGVGTFYNHFHDKFEVHQAVVLDTLEVLRRRVARSAARPGEGIEEQVRNLVEAVVAFAEESPARFRVAFGPEASTTRAPRAARGESPSRHPTRAQVGYSTRVTERRLAELQAEGALDPRLDPAVAARAFVAMQNSVMCWWLEDPSRASRAGLVETLVRLHPAVAAAVF
ncbi:MAG: TetR/AcrR family transcriptional regulator [Deltaproteobacteria bacterium]|nr:TetR/AcrR family transcriptional regulator [Deltaproteobacteria bacterium]